MINRRKWERLPPGTRLRKLARIIREAEEGSQDLIKSAATAETAAGLHALLQSRIFEEEVSPRLRRIVIAHRDTIRAASVGSVRRSLNALRHGVLDELGLAPGDWDLFEPDIRSSDD